MQILSVNKSSTNVKLLFPVQSLLYPVIMTTIDFYHEEIVQGKLPGIGFSADEYHATSETESRGKSCCLQ